VGISQLAGDTGKRRGADPVESLVAADPGAGVDQRELDLVGLRPPEIEDQVAGARRRAAEIPVGEREDIGPGAAREGIAPAVTIEQIGPAGPAQCVGRAVAEQLFVEPVSC
jgi:hypothetical protein